MLSGSMTSSAGSWPASRPGAAATGAATPEVGAVVETWPPWLALQIAEAGDIERAAAVMAGFPVDQSDGPGATTGYDLWFPSIAAEAAARCGTSGQRRQLYQRLRPLAGTHVVCGAVVAYAGAVQQPVMDGHSAWWSLVTAGQALRPGGV